jgi:hypothetical protein
MYREGEDTAVAGQDSRRPIALMHITIQDDHSFCPSLGLHGAGGNGAVIEHTITGAIITKGVVGSTCQIDGVALQQG